MNPWHVIRGIARQQNLKSGLPLFPEELPATVSFFYDLPRVIAMDLVFV